jgi:hypothetical protein
VSNPTNVSEIDGRKKEYRIGEARPVEWLLRIAKGQFRGANLQKSETVSRWTISPSAERRVNGVSEIRL